MSLESIVYLPAALSLAVLGIGLLELRRYRRLAAASQPADSLKKLNTALEALAQAAPVKVGSDPSIEPVVSAGQMRYAPMVLKPTKVKRPRFSGKPVVIYSGGRVLTPRDLAGLAAVSVRYRGSTAETKTEVPASTPATSSAEQK